MCAHCGAHRAAGGQRRLQAGGASSRRAAHLGETHGRIQSLETQSVLHAGLAMTTEDANLRPSRSVLKSQHGFNTKVRQLNSGEDPVPS